MTQEYTQTTTANFYRRSYVWPVVILLSSTAVGAAVAMPLPPVVRVPLVFWFMFVIPGMAFVRLFRLRSTVIEWVLAVALSLTLATLVSLVLLYTFNWVPVWGLLVLIVLSVLGALLQIFTRS